MTRQAELRCRCGTVTGTLTNAASHTVNRIVCYCDDCQAFLHHLKRADLLDAHGGTDIVQAAVAALRFDRGADRVVGVRLTPKGLYRWYAGCCNTPVGNTGGPAIPFVGIVAQAFEVDGRGPDDLFGKPLAGILGKFAIGTPELNKPTLGLLLRAVRKALGWWLAGRTSPSPFFDRATRAKTRPVTVLSQAERDALRPLCGREPA